MSKRHETKPSHTLRQAIGVATAGMLTVGAVLFGANKGNDTDIEAAVHHALRPTMARTAGKIIEFAAEHPSLTHKSVGKHFIDLTIAAQMKPEASARTPDTAYVDLIIRRQAGSTALDADGAVSLFMSRTGQVRGDADQTYRQNIDISPHAWSAQEHESVSGTGAAHPGININTIDAVDPVAAANRIAADTSSVLDQIEADLEYAENPDAHRLMP